MPKEAQGTADGVDGPYTELSDTQPFDLPKEDLKRLIRHYVDEAVNDL